MADKTSAFPIPGQLVEYVLLGPADDRRQLQDSPILGDVWLAYAAEPNSIQDLLITPHMEATAADVAAALSDKIERIDEAKLRKRTAGNAARIAYLQGIVAARLGFEEVLRVLVPLTQWWHKRDIRKELGKSPASRRDRLRERVRQIFDLEAFRAAKSRPSAIQDNFTALERYIALAALILWAGRQKAAKPEPAPSVEDTLVKIAGKTDGILNPLLDLFPVISKKQPNNSAKENRELIFQVSLNRRAFAALERSVPAVKADAAHRLFQVKCDKIAWAVLDSGIDGKHDAFQFKVENKFESRIRKTLDFTRIREIVSSDNHLIADELLKNINLGKTDARARLTQVAEDARKKRPVNWDVVEELITIANPPKPTSAHGTHVAGIIGADRNGNGRDNGYDGGLCPDIQLYDFRVLARSMDDTEFAIIAALQYIRYINDRHNFITIHGANLSLSIPHSVRNYACGRTPVCVECERLVDSGVVVVAAAGNRGYHNFETKEGIYEGYAAFSITDPGNADGVITVGATHGNWPHTYGVSFFSSRGPTGDGRLKPDLVAPGERVRSTVPGNEWGTESGTSMAAPHVSGAAAMLMARYPELVGQPRRIKKILCDSATDLGRERTFQGRGMLDVLRAFQSI